MGTVQMVDTQKRSELTINLKLLARKADSPIT